MTTIKRNYTPPNERSIDDKLGLLFASHKPLKQEVLTEAQDKQRKSNRHAEQDLQTHICKWVKLKWPDTIFISDFAAGLHLPINIAKIRSLQAPQCKVLDFTMLEPRGGYHGLIIEIKTLDGTPYLKNGVTLAKNEHTLAQNDTIQRLKAMGYAACFGIGENDIKNKIERYKGLPLNSK